MDVWPEVEALLHQDGGLQAKTGRSIHPWESSSRTTPRYLHPEAGTRMIGFHMRPDVSLRGSRADQDAASGGGSLGLSSS
jgi:hypothetical protein